MSSSLFKVLWNLNVLIFDLILFCLFIFIFFKLPKLKRNKVNFEELGILYTTMDYAPPPPSDNSQKCSFGEMSTMLCLAPYIETTNQLKSYEFYIYWDLHEWPYNFVNSYIFIRTIYRADFSII